MTDVQALCGFGIEYAIMYYTKLCGGSVRQMEFDLRKNLRGAKDPNFVNGHQRRFARLSRHPSKNTFENEGMC